MYIPEEVIYSAVSGFFGSLLIGFFLNREKKTYQPSDLAKSFQQIIERALLNNFDINSFGSILSFNIGNLYYGWIFRADSNLNSICNKCSGEFWNELSKQDKKYLNKVWKAKLESNKQEVLKSLQS